MNLLGFTRAHACRGRGVVAEATVEDDNRGAYAHACAGTLFHSVGTAATGAPCEADAVRAPTSLLALERGFRLVRFDEEVMALTSCNVLSKVVAAAFGC